MTKSAPQKLIGVRLLLILSTVLAVFVPLAGFAAGKPVARMCEAAFGDKNRTPLNVDQIQVPYRIKMADVPTVSVVNETGSIVTAHENSLELTGPTWMSMSKPEYAEAAPQGDPRWIAIILGGDLAHFLGVSSVSTKKMVVAHTDFMNKQIRALNLKLRALKLPKIPVRFFTSPDALESSENYNFQFANSGALPLSSDPQLYVHDISYHLGTLAVPPELLINVRKVTAVQNAFIKFLKIEFAKHQGEKRDALEDAVRILADNEAVHADVLIGSLVGSAAVFLHPKASPFDTSAYEYAIENLIEDYFTTSKEPTLTEILRARVELVFMNPPPPDIRWELSTIERTKFLDGLLTEFMKVNPQVGFDKKMPEFHALELFQNMAKRVRDLNRALKTAP